MGKKLELTGQRFGRLTVLEEAPERTKSGKIKWICGCSCGTELTVIVSDLKSGHTTSCGCIRTERLVAMNKTHGMTGKRIYIIWLAMRARCKDVNNKVYGGKDIKVCPEWENSFESFYEWAQEAGYEESLTIDRIDSNGNYCPENCRWVTYLENNRNREYTTRLTFNGESKTLMEWAQSLNMHHMTLVSRIFKYKWSTEKALTTPVMKHKEGSSKNLKLDYEGKSLTLKGWALELGMKYETLRNRISNMGQSIGEVIASISATKLRRKINASE